MRRVGLGCVVAVVVVAILGAAEAIGAGKNGGPDRLGRIDHIVVIYQENHSFDNLYGGWEGVEGLAQADAAHTTQVSQGGTPYACLLQNDVNLTSPPLASTCTDTTTGTAFSSAFGNRPFVIDQFIRPSDTTCPAPGTFAPFGVPKGQGEPGGCTRDLAHRFYQEQYQFDGGRQNRYVTGSDAVGLTMGTYRTRRLPIYRYLHRGGHPHYALLDAFFQSAFGGSYLNHQWLIAAATPTWPNPPASARSVVDSNGMPTSLPLYQATGPVADGRVTATCAQVAAVGQAGLACGDYSVNTTQPPYQPFQPGTAPGDLLPPQTHPTIGDRLSAAGVDWAWYSGGWSNANGDVRAPGWTNGDGPTCADPNTIAGAVYPNCPDKLFQFHHQPFNYFASFAPGTAARAAHVRDETEFVSAARASTKDCRLRQVSFVKAIGAENEHPGYTGVTRGSDHVVRLLRDIEGSRCAKDTMVVVTYDEFGGQWDHVPPPGQAGTPGPHDEWGPGTRIPALVIAPGLRGNFVVDHAQHDTTSILATIEQRFGLPPVATRAARVASLATVFDAKRGG